MSRLSDLIERYQDDIEYLTQQEDYDADDKIVVGVLQDVLHDLQLIGD